MSQHDQHPNAKDSARCAALTGSGTVCGGKLRKMKVGSVCRKCYALWLNVQNENVSNNLPVL